MPGWCISWCIAVCCVILVFSPHDPFSYFSASEILRTQEDVAIKSQLLINLSFFSPLLFLFLFFSLLIILPSGWMFKRYWKKNWKKKNKRYWRGRNCFELAFWSWAMQRPQASLSLNLLLWVEKVLNRWDCLGTLGKHRAVFSVF